MDLHPPGSMTSTHTGNPICCAAALASLECILKDNLAERARVLGDILHTRLRALQARHREIGHVAGKGLVAGISCVKPGGKEPDADLAWAIVQHCVESGVLMFSPVGLGGGTVKISPPLVISEEALDESLGVLEQAFEAVLPARRVVAG
jgi:4-aminobutyrate aminotransferase/(S)-3-amino-2-methylpropionate transaminase